MTGGRASRQKGNRTERAIVRVLQERGLAAERVPLSGSMRGRFGGDISCPRSVAICVVKRRFAGMDSPVSTTGSTAATFLLFVPIADRCW
jgi:hypothetical protein